MNTFRPHSAVTVVTIVVVWACTAGRVTAQDYAKWYRQSEQQFLELKQKAGGGTRMTWDKLPDWTGIWTRADGTRFDPKVPNYDPTTAKLTPEYQVKFQKKLADQKKGIEWDSPRSARRTPCSRWRSPRSRPASRAPEGPASRPESLRRTTRGAARPPPTPVRPRGRPLPPAGRLEPDS